MPGLICSINSNLGRRGTPYAPAGSFLNLVGWLSTHEKPNRDLFGLYSRRGDSPRREQAKVLAIATTCTRQSASAAFSRFYSAAEPSPWRRRVPKGLSTISVVDYCRPNCRNTSRSINLREISVRTASIDILTAVAHCERPLTAPINGPGPPRPLIRLHTSVHAAAGSVRYVHSC